jgi:hypothetical protein
MKKLDTSSIILVTASLSAIAILIYLYVNGYMKVPETFCACRHETQKVCPDPKVLTNLYNNNKLTEFTDFSKLQKEYPPKWKTIAPIDIWDKEMNYK